MTQLEMDYMKRAMESLEAGEISDMDRAKILQTMSEITARAAKQLRDDLIARVDELMFN